MRLVVEAEDFDEAVAFYRDSLGLREELSVAGEGGAEVVILDAGRATLELINPAQKRFIDEVEVGRQVSREIRVAFQVSDVGSETERLVSSGASLIADPVETPGVPETPGWRGPLACRSPSSRSSKPSLRVQASNPTAMTVDMSPLG
jgi:predicted enzyme related to lactoylglutathione lyase